MLLPRVQRVPELAATVNMSALRSLFPGLVVESSSVGELNIGHLRRSCQQEAR